MKTKKNMVVFWILLVLALLPESAMAQAAGGSAAGEIWDVLADKANIIGSGLGNAGFVIAGLGLVFFSFMAIFNKIKWSTLAYIMMSTFILSAMTYVIDMARDGGDSSWIGGVKGGTDAGTYIQYNVKEVPTSK